ncbi:MAG: undecaprenyl-diphosphate phosphatase [Brevinematales bacterium]|nr:undecaprenyl-diphosphate phosphatase [Brevinematales bacterium]
MDILKAVVMGFIQGVAEFLPISSSGHLVLADHYLRNMGKTTLWFDVLLHIATLIVVITFFFNEFLILVRGSLKFYKFFGDNESKLFWLVVLATVFTVIVALILEPVLRDTVESNYKIVGIFLIINSFILLVPYIIHFGTQQKNLENIGIFESIIIGISQGVGVLPGISRSGITISTGLVVGLDRATAGIFSFLIFIPSTIGAFVYETYRSFKVSDIQFKFEWSYLVGFVVALVVGYIALWLLMKLLREGKFYVFSIYTFVVGLLALIL